MKFREVGTILLAIFVVTCVSYSILHKVKPNFVKPDNFVEQYVEDVIKDKTGVELDLTPSDETGGFIQEIDWQKIQEMFNDEDE